MAYRIEFTRKAERQFKSLPADIQVRLKSKIDALAGNPRPHGSEKLSGEENFYRIRSGDYRVVYSIQAQALVVLVVKAGHRREVYR